MIPSDRDVWLSKKEKENNDLANDGWLMEEELREKESDMTDENTNKTAQCIKKKLLCMDTLYSVSLSHDGRLILI